MIQTDEDDEFERIAHEAKLKGQPYHYEPLFVSVSQRNQVLEEVAQELAKLPFGDTSASFSVFVRNMKK